MDTVQQKLSGEPEVLLIYAQRLVPGRVFEYIGNLGILTLAAALRQKGFAAHAFTGIATDAAALIEAGRDKLSAVCFYCDFDNQTAVASLARLVKEKTAALAIVGGPQTLHMTGSDLEEMGADAIIAGEGENSLADYLEQFFRKGLAEVPGLVSNGSRSPAVFEMLPDLAGAVVPDDALNLPAPSPALSIITARGCPYRCAFCFEGGNSKNLRLRPVRDVLEELEIRLSVRREPTYVLFQDDTFTIALPRLEEFLDGIRMLRKKYDFVWFCEGHALFFDKHPEALKEMVTSGLVRMQIGMESGSQKVLDAYGKCITPQLVRNVAALSYESGLPQLAGNFIVGGAFEDKATYSATEDFLISLIRDFPGLIEPSTTFIMPLPGTRVAMEPETMGIFLDDPDFITGLEDYPVNHTAAFSRWELCTLRRQLLSRVLAVMRRQYTEGKIPERFILSSIWLNHFYHIVNAYLKYVYNISDASYNDWYGRGKDILPFL